METFLRYLAEINELALRQRKGNDRGQSECSADTGGWQYGWRWLCIEVDWIGG